MSDDAPVYVVTGGCGFIGSTLAATLQRERPGCHVIVLDSFRTGSFAVLSAACRRIADQPFAGEVLPESVADFDWQAFILERRPAVIFHLGAITDTTVDDEAEMIRENAGEAWRYLLDSAIESGTPLVYASSAATYGTPPAARARTPFPEPQAGHPENVYGFSKWLMETAHRRAVVDASAAGASEPWVVGLRYFNVFGPGESVKGTMASMPFQLTHQILSGRRPRLFADGSQSRDQVPVEDIVGLTLAAGGIGGRERPRPGVYNAGSGRSTSFEEVASAVRRGLGVDDREFATEFFEMPASIARFYQSYTQADMSRAADGLGYTPRLDPIAAIERYARWLRDQGPSRPGSTEGS
ncbi:MAG: NAD-dependent epimerase/dehydratase family protein [Phycisphaerales bacterium]